VTAELDHCDVRIDISKKSGLLDWLLLWSWTMNTALPPGPNHTDWRALYRAAILEINKNNIPQKVNEAEQAVLARGRELFYSGGATDEKESLEDALYALRAFRTACRAAEAAWASAG
jgi:hypothetical protein